MAKSDSDVLEGSNNWVIAPRRSATGRPIMANDPHRAQSVPNLRYLSHIDTPELKIAGAGEPALPGISFGHNGEIAWALTIFNIDQQDLVVNPSSTPMTQVREVIEVKGEASREVILKFTRDGPVLYEDAASGRSFALRATWTQPGASAYFNASWAFTARTWDDFLVARNKWGAPPLNLLFASKNGDIGWAPGGFVPRRAAGDGLLPVPAGSRYRWNGMLDAKILPTSFNPVDGWLATANQYNVPAGYPHFLGLEWTDASRMERIAEVISGQPKFGIIDSMALQNDVTSPLARRAVALLRGLEGRNEGQKSALRLLSGWNGNLGADSAAAALFEIWSGRHLAATAVNAIVPEPARRSFGRTNASATIATLEANALLGSDPVSLRSTILLDSLNAAWNEAVSLLGPNPANWRWGTLHVADFKPALPIVGRDNERRVGPLPIGGGGSSPNALNWVGDFNLASGPSVRLVMDVGAWDNSVVINTPGQSGDPASTHYRDLFPLWAGGRYVPFPWTRNRVLQEAQRIIAVRPVP
jgi:penicillin G amidase